MENLKVVKVTPITKSPFNEDLSYFTTKEVEIGALVLISLRKSDILGVVTSIAQADELKSDLKSSDFGLKKIERIISNSALSPAFIEAARESAQYFVTSPGQIIRYLTPKSILDNWLKQEVDSTSIARITPIKTKRFEVTVLGMVDEERYSFYRSLIREEFAKKRSALFVLPTIHDVENCGELLKKGIEKYTTILHGRLPTKLILERWNSAIKEEHPVLIITTPSFISLPRDDLATIIVDKENSQFYKSMARPYIDIRVFAEKLSKKLDAKLILGDSIPRIEDIFRAEAGTFIPEAPLKYRFPKEVRQELIDMRKMVEENAILCPKTKQAVKQALENKEQILLVCTRKGLGTTTTCSDCGEIILCANCTLPMVLFRTKQENIFACNKCGAKSSTDIKCAKCSGWKLKALGVATEKIEEEVKSIFIAAKVFRLDSNVAKSYKQASKIIDDFKSTPGSILIATEMILNYLNSEIPNIAVISIDTLFSIPDFRISENIFSFLTRLKLLSLNTFLIQTRKPDEKIFEHVMRGDLLEFYRNEIKERKRFEFPPFKTLIKITAEGPKDLVNKEMNQLETFLKKYDPNKFNAFIERINNKDRINILLKIEPSQWPPKSSKTNERNEESPYSNLLEILESLPKRFVIKVEPENIL
ncbi:MAG: primosomal protein N' [Candidatus Vogelbacteria bacterium]|nr:primosomal protein N' [Candidatus Vogelbacteria bacterium]